MVVVATLTLFLFAFPIPLADLGRGPTFYTRILLYPADVTLALTSLAAIATTIAERRRPPMATSLLLALTTALTLAFLFHPSIQGVMTVLRFAAVSALALALSQLRSDERVLPTAALAAAAAAQVVLGLAQIAAGGPLGLPSFGEVADPLLDYDGVSVPRGTMHAVPVLAGLGVLAAPLIAREAFRERGGGFALGGGAVAAAIVGFTFSRAAAAGLVLACGSLLLGARSRRRAMAAVLCIAVGAAVPAVIYRAGWGHRANLSLSGRDLITEQALGLLADSPLVGVGPGRSLFALPEKYPEPPRFGYQPAHALPLIAAVEGGVLAGIVSVALLVALGWRARRDMRALAIYLAFLPAVLTDHYPYTYLQGQVLLAAWIGTLDALAGEPRALVPADSAIRTLLARARRRFTPDRVQSDVA